MGAASGIEITRATLADLPLASEILLEAAEWIAGRGEPLWLPKDLAPERLVPAVRDGSLHLARLRGPLAAAAEPPIGTVALSFEDPVFWPDEPAGRSAFVHRLAVRRAFAGGRVAPAMLEWAAVQARSAGRLWLRLDCSAAHPGLVRYYERAGFERCGEREISIYRAVLFERSLDRERGNVAVARESETDRERDRERDRE